MSIWIMVQESRWSCGLGLRHQGHQSTHPPPDFKGRLVANLDLSSYRRAAVRCVQTRRLYPITLANLVLNAIDEPNVWHGNTLTDTESYGGLFQGAPPLFDVILMNSPFGRRERQEA